MLSGSQDGHTSRHWHALLKQAVSPFSEGVGNLLIEGINASGVLPGRPDRTAAVLVPVINRAEPQIILTRRAEHLSHHPGQISFPGGAAEQGDDSAVDTALREAWEEIGLAVKDVIPLGFLDRIDTISGYRVLPVVGVVSQPSIWTLDRSEVDEVFEFPLALALKLSTYKPREIEFNGQHRFIYSIQWQDKLIWGVTAAIMRNLAMRAAEVERTLD